MTNFADVLSDPRYADSIVTTAIFSFSVATLALSAALFLAAKADRNLKRSQSGPTEG
jgi:sn-glycerol 3-phosphate transport system permease protein